MGGLLLFHLLGVLLFRSFSHFHAPANAASVTPPLFDLPHTRRQADAKAPVTTHPCGHSRTGSSLKRKENVQCPSPGPRQERPDAGRSPGSQVIARSTAPRGGQEYVSTCRSRWSPYNIK